MEPVKQGSMKWDRRDIRRQLPDYVVREGDLVYTAPYRATQADLNVFIYEADTTKLQELLDAELNQVVRSDPLLGSQSGLHFSSRDPWVIFIYAAFRSLSSIDEADIRLGYLSAFELSVWVPTFKRQTLRDAVIEEPAWFLPLVYTAPTASVVTGREVYGYPKVPAFLEVPDEGGPPISVRLRDSLPNDSNPGRGVRRSDSQKLFCACAEGESLDVRKEPLLGEALARFVGNVPLVFRKQVGLLQDEGKVHAGYSALVEARVPITRLTSLSTSAAQGGLPGTGQDSDVAARLGMRGREALYSIAVRGCTLDVQQGREIWVSAGRAPYIPPLAAPGNELISGLASAAQGGGGGVYGLEGPLSEVRGQAEVYFAKPRSQAIASLLERHFPGDLEGKRPVFDEARNFIMLCLVRALGQDSIKLYEFSVWVPVKHDGVDAFYVPYMFRSPGAAVVHAREWFGHPCQEAFITYKDGETRRSVAIRRPVSQGGMGVEWVRQEGVVFETAADTVDCPFDEQEMAQHRRELRADGSDQDLVSLFQVRHVADSRRACLQTMARSKRAAIAQVEQIPGFYSVSLPAHLRLGRLLDIKGSKCTAYGYRLNELWIRSTPGTLTWSEAQ